MTENIEQNGEVSLSVAFLVVIASFLLAVFLGAAFFVLLGAGPALVLAEVLLLILPLTYMFRKKINIQSFIGIEIKPKFVLLGIGLGVLLLLFNFVISAMMVSIFGESQAVQESQRLIQDTSASPTGLLLMIIALSLAGICEEFLFRGFLQTAINKKHSPIIAIVASSLVFGLFHFDPQVVYTASAFMMGLMFGYIYYRWRSYVVPAIAHATLNLIVLSLFLLLS